MKRNYFHALAFFFSFLLLIASGCEEVCEDDPMATASIAALQGKWIRVESNNPSADFVRVTVNDDEATITDKASSGFSVGDIKWRLIKPSTTANTFDYEELGSDGNYYAATLRLINNDEISISVNNSGAGNSQKWIRDDGSIPPGGGGSGSGTATELDCNYFTQDRTLVNTAADVDYIVPCVMDITASVTIEPGVVIEFEENAGLGIYDNGSLNMVGTSAEPIILRGKERIKGYWRGIHTETNSVSNRMEYVTIQDAGSNYVYCCNEVASLFVKDGKTVLQNTSIENGDGYGLIVGANAELPDFAANTITGHTDAPVQLGLVQTQYLDDQSVFSGNDVNFVEVIERAVNEATTVPALSIPYLLEGEVFDITADFAIDAGAELVFEENGGLGVFDNGSIQINGVSGEPVWLRGKQATEGYWRGIHIESSTINNRIKYAEISEAGGNYVYCCNEKATIFMKGTGKLELQHTTLSNGANYGLYVAKDTELREYGDNAITTHGRAPIYIAAERVGELDGMGSDYTGNGSDFIEILNSNIASATTWEKANVPYLIGGFVLDITEPLTIDPGVDIAFRENSGLGVYDNGVLKAVGTAAEKISFRGLVETPGYWRGIHTETNNPENELTHVNLNHAGGNYVYCCNNKAGLFVKAGQMKVTNSWIADNAGCGIFVKAGATLTEAGNTFSNNADGHICN